MELAFVSEDAFADVPFRVGAGQILAVREVVEKAFHPHRITRMHEVMQRAAGALRQQGPELRPPLEARRQDAVLAQVRRQLMADTLGPVLAQLAGLTQVLRVTRLDEVPNDQLRAVHGLLAGHAKAAQTIFNRWIDARQED